MRAATVLARWIAATLLSVLVTLPPALAVASFGVQLEENKYYAGRQRPPQGQDDLGLGFVGLSALIVYGGGSFIVLWPFALWGSYRLVRKVERKYALKVRAHDA